MFEQLPDSSLHLGGEGREENAGKTKLICMWTYDLHPPFRNHPLTTSQPLSVPLSISVIKQVRGIQCPQLKSVIWPEKDRNLCVSAKILGSDKMKSRLCYPLGIEKAWIRSDLLRGSEFTNILFHLLDHSRTEGTGELHKPDILSLLLCQI